jgi:lipopolysaccharide/colanic/teichoic acid biosynthesis glycosyltransferase
MMTHIEKFIIPEVILYLLALFFILRMFAVSEDNDFYDRLLKSSFDFVVSLLILVAISPVMLACALGVLISSRGPVFFLQERVGQHGKLFKIYKFRTMHNRADQGFALTSRGDPRIFWFGSVLRKLSFDELPQLINVLRGEMSLVGPRPHMPQARAAGILYHEAVEKYDDRHAVKPGMTGWAQVNGWRGPTETVEQLANRVEHDIWYTRHWNLLIDLKILVKTVRVAFFHENAF